MKLFFVVIVALSLGSSALAQDKAPLKDERDKVSYSIGLDIGNNLKKQKIEINTEALLSGLNDAINGNKPLMTEEEMKNTAVAYQQSMMKKLTAEGEKFLAENKGKEGVRTTPSGLQYKVLKEGSGPTPKETDTVETHYRGTLPDGTEFDSSYSRNQPATFPVNGVIPGWTEALKMMKVGSKYQLFVPANLAYGERGQPRAGIGPNQPLIFEVELLSIKKEEPPAAAASPAPTSPPPASKK